MSEYLGFIVGIIMALILGIIVGILISKILLAKHRNGLMKNMAEKIEEQDKRFCMDGKEVNIKGELIGKDKQTKLS